MSYPDMDMVNLLAVAGAYLDQIASTAITQLQDALTPERVAQSLSAVGYSTTALGMAEPAKAATPLPRAAGLAASFAQRPISGLPGGSTGQAAVQAAVACA